MGDRSSFHGETTGQHILQHVFTRTKAAVFEKRTPAHNTRWKKKKNNRKSKCRACIRHRRSVTFVGPFVVVSRVRTPLSQSFSLVKKKKRSNREFLFVKGKVDVPKPGLDETKTNESKKKKNGKGFEISVDFQSGCDIRFRNSSFKQWWHGMMAWHGMALYF